MFVPSSSGTKAYHQLICNPLAISHEEPENITSLDDTDDLSGSNAKSSRPHLISTSRRLPGRARRAIAKSYAHQASMSSASSHEPHSSDTDSTLGNPKKRSPRKHHVGRHHPHHPHHIISQVAEWLHQEKARQVSRRDSRRTHRSKKVAHPPKDTGPSVGGGEGIQEDEASRRSSSDQSTTSRALEQLEKILVESDLGSTTDFPQEHGHDRPGLNVRPQRSRKASLLLRKQKSFGQASESETRDAMHIPSAEVILDNTRVCSLDERRKSVVEDCWTTFKREIVRLTHTLGIHGWRRISIEAGAHIEVNRLCGALTNAVYVVTPPPDLEQSTSASIGSKLSVTTKKRPQ